MDARVHRALAGASRVRLLRVLQHADRPLTAQALAEETGLHLSTVRAHLGVLIEADLVDTEPEERRTPGRPRLLYRARPDGPATEVGDYRLLAEILAGYLAGTAPDSGEQARAAGRVWGSYLVEDPPPHVQLTVEQTLARVVDMLAPFGFDPEVGAGETGILLRRCPFLDVARRHPDVVCSLHLGMLEGALDALGGVLTAQRLEPFVEPSLCVAHLRATVVS